jgi:hypothetical protein
MHDEQIPRATWPASRAGTGPHLSATDVAIAESASVVDPEHGKTGSSSIRGVNSVGTTSALRPSTSR